MVEITIELIFGIWGAVLSTILAIIEIKKYLGNKPKLVIDIKRSEGWCHYGAATGKSFVFDVRYEIMNKGNKPTTIREVNLKFKDFPNIDNPFKHALKLTGNINANETKEFGFDFCVDDKKTIKELRSKDKIEFSLIIIDTYKETKKDIIIKKEKSLNLGFSNYNKE